MSTPEVIAYIKNRIAAGADPESIRDRLIERGWQKGDVKKAFAKAGVPLPGKPQKKKPVKPAKPAGRPSDEIAKPSPGQTIVRPGPAAAATATATPSEDYAGFWLRLVAIIFDYTVIYGVLILLAALSLFFMEDIGSLQKLQAFSSLGEFILFVLPLLYFAYMESTPGRATLGKKIAGIAVTGGNGERLPFVRSLIRNLAKIVSSIPLLAGFVIAAFTKKKQALHDIISDTLVVKARPANILKAVGITVLLAAVVLAGVGAYIYSVAWPKIMQAAMTAALSPNGSSDWMSADSNVERTVEQPVHPVSLSEAEYNSFIETHSLGTAQEGGTELDPFVLKLSNFWEDAESPHIWLDVLSIPLPNLDLCEKAVKVQIDHVWDRNGQDIYDSKSSFETEFFATIQLSESGRPEPHLKGIRDIRLLKGAKEGDIARVEGTVYLYLPLGIEVLNFEAPDVGKEITGSKTKITMTRADEKMMHFDFKGPAEYFIKALGYNDSGQQLESSGYSSSSGNDNEHSYSFGFQGVLKNVEVILASDIAERQYAFSLEK